MCSSFYTRVKQSSFFQMHLYVFYIFMSMKLSSSALKRYCAPCLPAVGNSLHSCGYCVAFIMHQLCSLYGYRGKYTASCIKIHMCSCRHCGQLTSTWKLIFPKPDEELAKAPSVVSSFFMEFGHIFLVEVYKPSDDLKLCWMQQL